MRFDRGQIENALAPLVGLPIWGASRAADLQTFQLGARLTRIAKLGPRAGQAVILGEYRLHLQCGWRVTGPEGIVVARGDLYAAAGADPDACPEDWDWDVAGASRRDERVQAWLRDRSYTVEAVAADTLGGCMLTLSDGHALEVFADDSLDDEYWRLLPPGEDAAHFVVTGAGIAG